MGEEINPINILPPVMNKIDPTGYDITVSAFLIGMGAEKYLDIFRNLNIGQTTLVQLTDEDLFKLGVDDFAIRKKIMEEVKNLPIYAESALKMPASVTLGLMDIVDVLEESSQHLYRIYLSMLANTLSVKKTRNIPDCLLYKDQYASDVALRTLSEITNILNSMDNSLHTQMKMLSTEKNSKTKKIIVGSVGSAVIIMLAVFFTKSLKQLK